MCKFGNYNVVRFMSGQAVCKSTLGVVKACALACKHEVQKFENPWKLTLFVLCLICKIDVTTWKNRCRSSISVCKYL